MRSGAAQSKARASRNWPSLCSTASKISQRPGRELTSAAPAPSPKRIAVFGSRGLPSIAPASITADIFSAPITSTSPKRPAISAAIARANSEPALAMGTSIAGALSRPSLAATSAAGPGNPGRALPLATTIRPNADASIPARARQSSAAATARSATVVSAAAHRRSRMPDALSIHSAVRPTRAAISAFFTTRSGTWQPKAWRNALMPICAHQGTLRCARWNRISAGSDRDPGF